MGALVGHRCGEDVSNTIFGGDASPTDLATETVFISFGRRLLNGFWMVLDGFGMVLVSLRPLKPLNFSINQLADPL